MTEPTNLTSPSIDSGLTPPWLEESLTLEQFATDLGDELEDEDEVLEAMGFALPVDEPETVH